MVTDYEVTEAMMRHGGSFVQQLGKLLRLADEENAQRLKKAFPEYWEKYSTLMSHRIEK